MLVVTTSGWIVTIVAIGGLLALDWFMLGRRPHAVRMGAAAWWSAFYVTIAISFGVIFSLINGWELGAQFFTGYVVEYSLSVDNLFVFVIIIGSFAVPAAQQPKTLSVGIAVALILRAAFIAVGAALLDLFSFMFLIFGAALLATAVQLYRHRDQDPHLGDNAIVNLARRVLPFTTSYDESRIITYRHGRRLITPLFLALLAIGTTDVLFAFDSIPAVFGVTDHAYIVFAANAFALLGLRPLFFLVSGLLDRLVYMSTGLALILGFIGLKLVLEFGHKHDDAIPEISTVASLAVIASVLAVTTLASLIRSRRTPGRRAHAGALRQPQEDPAGGPLGPGTRLESEERDLPERPAQRPR